MAASTRTLVAAIGALTLSLSYACGEDTTKPGNDGDGDGAADGSGSDGSGSDGSGSDGSGSDGDDAPNPTLGDNVAGKACTEGGGECGEGTCTDALTAGALGGLLDISINTPGGYCTAECSADTSCGAGGVCFAALPIPAGLDALIKPLLSAVGITSTDGECRQACETDGCRDGYECAKTNEAALAMVDSMVRQYIQLPSTCQPSPVPDQLTDEAGKACSTDGDCGQGVCNKDPEIDADAGGGFPGLGGGDATVFPGGYCSGVCTQDSHCGTGGVCVLGFYGSGGNCFEGCSDADPCSRAAEGYTCQEFGGKSVCGYQAPEEDAGTQPDGDAGTQPDGDAGVGDAG